MIKAGLTFKEVDRPDDGICDTGHVAPDEFRRGGSDSPSEPTKFFKCSGVIQGTYCEPCLMIINHVAKLKKEGKL